MFNHKGALLAVVVISAVWYVMMEKYNINDTEQEKSFVKEQVEGWKAKGKYFSFEGKDVFYIDHKNEDKEVLLVLHGFPSNSWDFKYILPDLTNRFHVVLFDFIGFGLSAKPVDFNYTIVKQADVTISLLSKLDIKEFHILAHDYGVSVAQELMARHQNKENKEINIKSVAFLNGGLFYGAYKPLFTQQLLASPIGPYMRYVMSRSTLASSLKKIFGSAHPPTKEEVMIFWEFISINDGLSVFPNVLKYIHEREIHDRRWARPIAKASYPIRLVNGPADPISGRNIAEYFTQVTLDSSRADVVILDDSVGHYPHLEAPTIVSQELQKFWNKVDKFYEEK